LLLHLRELVILELLEVLVLQEVLDRLDGHMLHLDRLD
jgi:hypothetical protein